MSTNNICNFNDIISLSTREINNRFRIIHKYLCFLGGGGSGAPVNAANNGLSLSFNTAVLGQDVGALGDPASLLNTREIPLNGFGVNFVDNDVSAQFAISLKGGNGVNFFYNSDLSGLFMSFNFADLFTGAAIGISNDASANITFTNQNDLVMSFLPSGDVTIGRVDTTHSLTVLGNRDSGSISDKVILQNGQITLVANSDDTVPPKINFVNNADASNASIAWGNDQLIFDAFQIVLTPDPSVPVQINGDLTLSGAIQTGDPGLGAATWQLGSVITALSALDTTRYVQVKIGGVVVKLAVIS